MPDANNDSSKLKHFTSGNMLIKVLFFASAKEITGKSKTEIELSDGQTTADLVSALTELYPSLNITRDQISIAVNQTYCREVKVLNNNDEVALLPPISGG